MPVMIAFATIEGQTGKIARFAESEVRKAGHDVVVVDVTDESVPVDFENINMVILAAPVHERRHPKKFELFLAAKRRDLEVRRTLLLSVSLSAAFPEGLEEANEYVVEMRMRTKFSPDREALVAGAVRTSHYDYFASQVVRHVVMRGRDYDADAGEHEFTDWQRLASSITEFLSEESAGG